MTSIYLALFAYFLNAVVFLVDKYLLSAPIPRPLAYAFWVSVLSSFALVLIPFGVIIPSAEYLAVAFIAGLATYIGLIFLYESIMAGDISVAATKVGAFSAITGYLLSIFILRSEQRDINFIAFVFLVAGIYFLSRSGGKVILKYSIVSGFCLGLSLVLLKWCFNNSDFINGVFWTRIFFVLPAFLTLLSPEARHQIFKAAFRSPPYSRRVFIFNKLMAACGFLILYYAIKLGSVEMINALLGFQFVFVFIFALALRHHYPKLEEKITRPVLINKLIGVNLIVLGFILALV